MSEFSQTLMLQKEIKQNHQWLGKKKIMFFSTVTNISNNILYIKEFCVEQSITTQNSEIILIGLNMINPFLLNYIAAVKNNFTFQLVLILLDFIVLHHDDNHIHIVDKFV